MTSVSAGSGLTGGGIERAVSLAVDSGQVQSRVSGDCTSSPITMIGSEVLSQPGTANVECYDGGDAAASAYAQWEFLTITAIKLDDLGPQGSPHG